MSDKRLSTRVLRNDLADPCGGALLVHGNAASCELWRWVVPRLKRVQYVAPDLRGFGQAPEPPDGKATETWLHDLAQMAERLPWPRVLVGAGAGALLVGMLAQRHPELCNRAVLVGPVGLDEGHGKFERVATSARGSKLLRKLGTSIAGRRKFLGDQLADPDHTDAAKVQVLLDALTDARSFHLLAQLSGAQSLPALRDLPGEVTVLWGERDGVLPAEHAPRFLEYLPARHRLEIVPGAGHALPLERPEIVADAIEHALGVPRGDRQ